MEKDKKYNVVLGLMIFFFILVVGISLAWGLSSISKEDNSEDTKTENVEKNNASQKEEIVKDNNVSKENNDVVTQNNVVKENTKQETTTNNTTSSKKEEVNNSSEKNTTNTVKVEENVQPKEEEKIETENTDEKIKDDIQISIDRADAQSELALIFAEVVIANNINDPFTGYINPSTLVYTDSVNGIAVKSFYENKLKEKGYNMEVVIRDDHSPIIK